MGADNGMGSGVTTVTAADRALADALMRVPGVVAVGLGGSRATGLADELSDTDLYGFFAGAPGAPEARRAVLAPPARGAEDVGTGAFGPEDHLRMAGQLVEVVYIDVASLAETVAQAQGEGLSSDGFTTACLHTAASCTVLADVGTLAQLRTGLAAYPEATLAAIVAHAREVLPEWLSQLGKAQRRGDLAMVTHRRASIQAVWFDVLFAVNRCYHPGEKRLLEHASALERQPRDLRPPWGRACLLRAGDVALPVLLGELVDEVLALSAD